MTGRDGRVGVGVVGCGVIAYWVYLRLLGKMPDARLVVASDPSPVARARAEQIVKCPVVESAANVLETPGVDAVVICAPSEFHADLAIAALKSGKHVFVEKPIAIDADSSARVMSAVARTSCIARVGFNRRRHPMFEQAKAMLADGVIGEVRAIQSAFCEPTVASEMSEWRKTRERGGGVLLDLGSHHFDLMRWFLSDEVDSVACSTQSVVSEDDTAEVTLAMSRGVTVQSFFSFRSARADYLEFIGERGTLLIDKHTPVMTVRKARRWGYGTRRSVVVPSRDVATWRARRIANPSNDPSYERSLESFLSSIRGNDTGGATMEDGVRSLEVVLAAESSAKSGARVMVER